MSCAITAIIAVGVAFYQVYYLSIGRVFFISIQGGDIAMNLGLLTYSILSKNISRVYFVCNVTQHIRMTISNYYI